MSNSPPKSILYRAKYRLVSSISKHPAIYYGIRRTTGKHDHLCVNSSCDIVIEGFPRSANSTTAHGFIKRQPVPVRVAHHKHHAAQLLRGRVLNIPCVVLIRDPVSAVLSHMALREVSLARKNQQHCAARLGFADVMKGYIDFYTAADRVLDELVIAPFDEVTKNISKMINDVNDMFGTCFALGYHEQNYEITLGDHALPTQTRNEIKQQFLAKYQNKLMSSKNLRKQEYRARKIHDEYIVKHERRR